MFEYLARIDPTLPLAPSAESAATERSRTLDLPPLKTVPHPLSPPVLPSKVDSWVAKSFPRVRFAADPAYMEDWLMGFNQHPRLKDEIVINLQQRIGLATTDQATKSDPATEKEREAASVAAWRWVQQECLCGGAARVALAQRTFRWLLDWKASFAALPEVIRARPELKSHRSFAPLLADLQAAPPHIQHLKLSMADPAKRSATIEFNLVQAEEHLRAISTILGALVCFHPYLVPEDASLPPNLPARHSLQCLDRGTGWLCAKLSQNAEDAHAGKLLQWPTDEIGRNWKIVTNGCDSTEAQPEAAAILRELGLDLIVDAEGVAACGASHQESIKTATRDPLPSVVAAYIEPHLPRILSQALDALFATNEARHASSSSPSDLPDPEAPLHKKCEHVYTYLQRYAS